MSYNIEWMNNMFTGDKVKPDEDARARTIAQVISGANPDLIAISEAANSAAEHAHFIDTYLAGGYKAAMGVSRGAQNLVFYYREPLHLVSVDPQFDFYLPWEADIDDDGIIEKLEWERKPLEAVFRVGMAGPELHAIVVHTKSKGVFSVVDLHDFEKVALANRKKLAAQAERLRHRLDGLIAAPNARPVVVLGDMNDGPGMDAYERVVGRSFVETLAGDVFAPELIFHNTLWWMNEKDRKDLWTAEFPDPIVSNSMGLKHRVWIDHILVSPSMLKPDSHLRYVTRSGRVGGPATTWRKASDHRPVTCELEY
jgi:endonuclease/exonuclease/phosphatase family metal-dependent hydrolase